MRRLAKLVVLCHKLRRERPFVFAPQHGQRERIATSSVILVISILLDVSAPELGHAWIGLEDEHGTMLVSECLGGFQSVGASA